MATGSDDEDLRRMVREFRGSVTSEMAGMGDRLDILDGRMGGLEVRMDGLEVRMDGLEVRMGRLETRMTGLEKSVMDLGDEVRSRFQTTEVAILNAIRDLGRSLDGRITRIEDHLGFDF